MQFFHCGQGPLFVFNHKSLWFHCAPYPYIFLCMCACVLVCSCGSDAFEVTRLFFRWAFPRGPNSVAAFFLSPRESFHTFLNILQFSKHVSMFIAVRREGGKGNNISRVPRLSGAPRGKLYGPSKVRFPGSFPPAVTCLPVRNHHVFQQLRECTVLLWSS